MAFSFLRRMRESSATDTTRKADGCIDGWMPVGQRGYLVLGWCTEAISPTAECRATSGARIPKRVDWMLRAPRADVAPALALDPASRVPGPYGFALFLPGLVPDAAGLVLRFGPLALDDAAPSHATDGALRERLAHVWSHTDATARARLFQTGLPPEIEILLPVPAQGSKRTAAPSSDADMKPSEPGGTIDSWASVTSRPGILIEGWCSASHPRVLIEAGEALHAAAIGWMLRYPRPDVTRALGLSRDQAAFGFVIFIPGDFLSESITRIVIVDDTGGRITRSFTAADAGRTQQVLASTWRDHSRRFLEQFAGTPPPEILSAVAHTADDPGGHASFHVDHLLEVPDAGLLVDGWALDQPTAPLQVLIVDESSSSWVDLSTGWTRHERLDLLPESERQGGKSCGTSGFLALVKVPRQVPAFGQHSTLAIYGITATGEVTVQRVRLGRQPPMKERIATVLSRVLGSPQQRLQSLARHAGPSIDAWLQARAQDGAPARNEVFGTLVTTPRVSILIVAEPDVDLIRVQLARLSLDPYIRSATELLCVVDDRSLLDPAWTSAAEWHLTSGLPLRMLATAGDMGFAAAIRLAAREARGKFLLLLAADCLPDQPGWLQQLVQALEADAACGAVGPTLCSLDGAIFSAGQWIGPGAAQPGLMTVREWVRSPIAEPAPADATPVQVVSGACLLTRSDLFRSLGGLESGFLGRHDEAAVYCGRLAAQGYSTRLLAGPRLHHLAVSRRPELPDKPGAPCPDAVDPERAALYNAWRLDAGLRALGHGA